MNLKIWSIISTILYFAAAAFLVGFVVSGQDWMLVTGAACMLIAVITGIPLHRKNKK